MTDPTFTEILNRVATGINEIDSECTTRLNDIEHGLVNVKREFQDRAYVETGKNKDKLTEEILIAWRLRPKLSTAAWQARPDEEPYPNDHRKHCDLVIDINGTKQLWIELKVAWKAWFNCTCEPTYSNGWYRSYLDGNARKYSFHHDLEKLAAADLSPHDGRAVCLVGFDYKNEPMEEDVRAVVRNFQNQGHRWEVVGERHWPDRRKSDFRINVWCWLLTE